MAAYVTLAQAQAHLRDFEVRNQADIWFKTQQASGIVLNFLTVRPVTIASVSAANPAVVTTSWPHNLISGVTYTLADTTTTPTVNGANVITVTGATTFTVPVNVTSAQTSAAGTVSAPSLTAETAPVEVQAATLLVLTHLYQNRGDNQATDETLWAAIGRLLVRRKDSACA